MQGQKKLECRRSPRPCYCEVANEDSKEHKVAFVDVVSILSTFISQTA